MDSQTQLLTAFQRKLLLKHIEIEQRPEYRRRIEIMLLADEGHSQTQICEKLGCAQETARLWMGMARDGKAHLWQDRPIGRPHTVNNQYLARLRELVSHDPRTCGYPFRQWTAQWLSKHLADEFGIEISDRHINRLLKKMGLSTRSRCAQNATDSSETKEAEITIQDLQPTELPSVLLINPLEVHL